MLYSIYGMGGEFTTEFERWWNGLSENRIALTLMSGFSISVDRHWEGRTSIWLIFRATPI
jgi:hypothetical protein